MFVAMLFVANHCDAQELIASYKHWSLWCDGTPCKVCTITTHSQTATVATPQHNFLLVYVTASKKGEVSAVSHQDYRTHSHPDLLIDGERFELFSKKNRAWAIDTATDKKIIGAMIKGLNAFLSGVAQSGKPIREKFSLVGFGSAWQKANKVCPK